MLNALVRIATRQGGTQILFDVVRAPNTHERRNETAHRQHNRSVPRMDRVPSSEDDYYFECLCFARLLACVLWLFAAQTVYTMGIF